ncbi:hypothetical protein IW150_004468 [Coemansia sp. RSA 2607]|nr:hypothetical protein IW150_004468 [Coemansia sp. RSA 2607]
MECSNEPAVQTPRCPNCSQAEILSLDSTEEYCSNCGAVLSEASFSHTNAAHGEDFGTYIRLTDARYNTQAASGRLTSRWNQAKLHAAHQRLLGFCTRLGTIGQRERAQHLFDGYVERVAQETGAKKMVFGYVDEVLAACVYMAAAEDGGRAGCALGDMAAHLGISVFALGAAVGRVCRRLELQLPPADGLLRVAHGADMLGVLARETGDEHVRILGLIGGKERAAGGVATLVLELLAQDAAVRSVAFVAQGAYEFCVARDRHAGFAPATVAGCAVALAVEQAVVVCDGWSGRGMQKCQRAVVERLVALAMGCGMTSIQRFSAGVRKVLCSVGQAAPALRDVRLTADEVCVYLGDILLFHRAAQGVAKGALPRDAAEALALAGTPRAFAQAQERRSRRLALGSGEHDGREARAVQELCGEGGIDHSAVLSLPVHTLEALGPVHRRERERSAGERARLNEENVGDLDMSEAEIAQYMR